MEIRNNGWKTIAGVEKLALVGMDAILGIGKNLAALEYAIFTGRQQTRLTQDDSTPTKNTGESPSPEELGLGFWGLAGKIERLSEEDQLLLMAAMRALRDAGFEAEGMPAKTALLFCRGSEFAALCAPAQASERVSTFDQVWDFPGKSLNLSEAGNPLAAGLMEADQLLNTGEVEVVLLASCCMAKDFAWLVENNPEKLSTGPLVMGLDCNAEGWTVGEGACAVAVMRPQTAAAQGKRVYAVIDALACTLKEGIEPKKNPFPTFLSSETILRSCQQALSDAKADPGTIGTLEVLGSGFTPVDTAEITGLTRAYGSAGAGLTCALGSIQANTGYLFSAAGLAALVKTALCLYHRVIPMVPQWSGPKKPELWADSPFYAAVETRTWFLDPGESERAAAVNVIGWDGSCTHLVLRDPYRVPSDPSRVPSNEIEMSTGATQGCRPNPFLQQAPFTLFPVSGNTQAELLQGLDLLQEKIQQSTDWKSAARWNFEAFQKKAGAEFALAVVGQDRDELLKEIEFAGKNLAEALEQKKSWQTPLGSVFAGDPVGKQGDVAFVYPGAFNSYVGLGREIFLLFPQLYEQVTRLTTDLGSTLQEQQLYPRSLEALSKEELTAMEASLSADPIAMMTSGSLMAVAFTMILRDIFKVQPQAAFGYSLGEIAMMFGMGIWDEADEIQAVLSTSPLFRNRLSGPQNAVRAYWGLPLIEKPEPGLWSNYFLMSTAEKVAEAVALEERVYLTHINTPRQVVIGGDPASCQRVIDRVKCNSLKAPFDFALHCDAMRSEYEALIGLHTWQIAARPETRLYSAADNRPLALDSRRIAENISSMLCSSLDFPALIQQVYADGARVFVELGANANCSKWIDDTLKGRPYAAIPINRRGADDQVSMVRMLAKLVSQRVPVDLTALY
jgi:PfaB family protein